MVLVSIAKSGLSVTDLDQVYPYDGSGTLNLSGTTTTPYDEAYLPVIKNAFRAKGGDNRLFDVEKVIYNYARSVSDVFEKEDNGTITVREGASFDNLNVTFDEIITDPLGKERSFSDEDQVEFESYGNILDTPTSAEDYGVIEQQLQGGIFLDEYQATFVGSDDAIVRGYEGLGTFKKEGVADRRSFLCILWIWYTQHSLERTSSVRLHKAQSSVSVIRLLHLVVQMRRSSLQLLITPFSSISLELVQKAQSYYLNYKKVTIRPSGSVSGIKLVKLGDEQTVTLHLSGGATDIALVKDYENTNLFDITGEMQQGIPVYTPSWVSPLGDQTTEEYDWGLITATPTQPSEDWGTQSIQTTRQYPRLQRTGDSYFQSSTTFRLVENIIQTESYILSWRIQSGCQTTGDVTGIATFLLSEDLDVASAISYESSGITGIATYNAICSSVQTGSSQAVQHRVIRS